jgi:predicted AlkP superfamily pyrophosphatase or phosphodiesterase
MARTLFVLVAGLDRRLVDRTPQLATLRRFAAQRVMRPVTPAVTSTMQATLTTGGTPAQHGIIANGLFAHNRPEIQRHLDLSSFAAFRRNVSFWEQSNRLLELPRFWHQSRKTTTMLFWQNSMDGAADVVLTPKPTHSPDGKTLTACWSAPDDLYARLVEKLGPLPLHNYWGPFASGASSEWIVQAALAVWAEHPTDLTLLYVPHLDYALQRLGPAHEKIAREVQFVDALLAPLVERARADGAHVIIAGDYGMHDVTRAIMPNQALRQAGLLLTKPDAEGKLLVDYDASHAFAMVDHQIAHVYCPGPRQAAATRVIAELPGVARVLHTPEDLGALGLASPRSGAVVALAEPDAWFCHDWWTSDAEKPAWQFSVDIHRKPGYDPRELFGDPVKKCVAQNPELVKGSHGVVLDDPATWPVLLCDESISPATPQLDATDIAGWLARLV